jgi:dihydrofolate synthase/folylpolyglutamate synthase
MTYQEIVSFLYAQLPAFQNLGKKAIKPTLKNIEKLCQYLGNPQLKFKSIHVAGTNGKGSTSHMLASILQESGYKTGLYTSPHLKDFRERFRIDGLMVEEEFIIDFVIKHKSFIVEIKPSFFEVTVAMAFQLFAERKVDFAVIETGLGGRLDSTNIINPILSIITNIGLDHTDVLGDTLEKIAFEKAGIIKENTPIIISENQKETFPVFTEVAKSKNAPLIFSEDSFKVVSFSERGTLTRFIVEDLKNKLVEKYDLDLKGYYQKYNLLGVFTAAEALLAMNVNKINKKSIQLGMAKVMQNTGLKGRWQILHKEPLMVCDTGHNSHAFNVLLAQIAVYKEAKCHFILGFAKDKKLEESLGLLPNNQSFYFCTFDSIRSRTQKELISCAINFNITNYGVFDNVNIAISSALGKADKNDFIYIGGSTYLVAEIENL